jgi:hypothetical protein
MVKLAPRSADDELINPTGLEIGADGDIYISNKGFIAGQGEVLRLSLEKDTTCGCAPLYDPLKDCMMAIAADSELVNASHPLLGHSVFCRVTFSSLNADRSRAISCTVPSILTH